MGPRLRRSRDLDLRDIVLAYPRPSGWTAPTTLQIRSSRGSTTISTRTWRKPPVPSDEVPSGKVETTNCIHDARRIPGTQQILLELWHRCLVSGDWSTLGGPTWHVVGT